MNVCAISSAEAILEFETSRLAALENRHEWLNVPTAQFRPQLERVGSVAVIPVSGVIHKRAGIHELASGAFDVDDLCAMAAAVAADPTVSGALLDIDSPGGYVVGLPEAREAVQALAAVKDVMAFTDTLCASAAFEIAAGASAVVATPSALVGSVGSMMTRLDISEALASAGVVEHQFTNGTMKGLGNPAQAMGEEEAAAAQARVDFEGERFRSVIRARFPDAPESAMQGQGLRASEAMDHKLLDALVGSRDEAIDILAGRAA